VVIMAGGCVSNADLPLAYWIDGHGGPPSDEFSSKNGFRRGEQGFLENQQLAISFSSEVPRLEGATAQRGWLLL